MATNGGLSMGELRQRLQSHLKANGSLRQLKTQLRSMILSEVVQGGVTTAPLKTSPSSVASDMTDALVLQHLRATNRSFTISVFSSEASPVAADEDLTSLLPADAAAAAGDSSLLTALVAQAQKQSRLTVAIRSMGTQTSEVVVDEMSMEKKLAMIDSQWALRQRSSQDVTRASYEVQLAMRSQELEDAMREETARQIQKFKVTELGEMRKQEQARYDAILSHKREEFAEMERSIQHRLELERGRLDLLRQDMELRSVDLERRAKSALGLVQEREERIATLEGQLKDYSERMQRMRADQMRYEELANQRLQDLELARMREQRRIDDIRRLQAEHMIELRLRADSMPPPRTDCVRTTEPRYTDPAPVEPRYTDPAPVEPAAVAEAPARNGINKQFAPAATVSNSVTAMQAPANVLPTAPAHAGTPTAPIPLEHLRTTITEQRDPDQLLTVQLVRPVGAVDAAPNNSVPRQNREKLTDLPQVTTPRTTSGISGGDHSPPNSSAVHESTYPASETERHASQQLSQLSSIAIQSAMHRTQAQASEISRSASEESVHQEQRSMSETDSSTSTAQHHPAATLDDARDSDRSQMAPPPADTPAEVKPDFVARDSDPMSTIVQKIDNLSQSDVEELLANGGSTRRTIDLSQIGIPAKMFSELLEKTPASDASRLKRQIASLVLAGRVQRLSHRDFETLVASSGVLDERIDFKCLGYSEQRLWKSLEQPVTSIQLTSLLRVPPALWTVLLDESDLRNSLEHLAVDAYPDWLWDFKQGARKITERADAKSGVHVAAAVVPVLFADHSDSDDDVAGLLVRSGSDESF